MRAKRFSGGALLDNRNNKKADLGDAPIVASKYWGASPWWTGHRIIRRYNSRHRYRHDKTSTDRTSRSLYKFGQSPRTEFYPENSVPLFLSDYDGEPDPSEYITPLRKKRRASSRILAGVSATAAAAAILFALFSSDVTRDVIVNAKASIAAVFPARFAAAQPDPAQLTASDIELKDTARPSAPAQSGAWRSNRHNDRRGAVA